MEELLNKDIFRETELLKHAPDFTSQEIYLRLQLRRDMVKDNHKHRKVSTEETKQYVLSSRNVPIIEKLHHKIYNNSYYKVNTEIAKIHTLFRNKNAINKLNLKKYKIPNKLNVKMKPDMNYSKIKYDKDDETLVEKELYAYVQDAEDIPDLLVENENDFKLLPKVRPKSTDHKKLKHKNKIEFSSNCNENIDVTNKTSCYGTIETKAGNVPEYCHDFVSEQKNLQSLLIMMTISSNYNETNGMENVNEYKTNEIANIEENIDTQNNMFNERESINYERVKDISDVLSVRSIKKPTTIDFNTKLIEKYVLKWKAYVKVKTENKINHRRNETLNMFLDKIKKAKNSISDTPGSTHKAKSLVRDYNSYQHRYKVQRSIIALQKAQLEQKNKIIEELKYNKIVEASQKSLDTMKEEVRKTYYEIDKHLKPRIKLLTNELKIKEIEEPSLVLNCLKVPQFLQRMEARAREREEKHAIIRERRQQMEQEKIRFKQQAELEKAEMNKEEKNKRMAELKEKRKREKIENIRKKQHAERIRALSVMADLHYERNLMLKYGIRSFQKLLQIKRDNIDKAQTHYKFQLMKNVFLNWMFFTEDMWFERNFKAEEFYRKRLLTNTFQILKKNHYYFILKKQVAEDYYDLYVTQLVFRKFREGINIAKEEFALRWTKAENYNNCNLLFKTFTCWRTLPALNALKREQEARKLKWREKVLQVVPDYKPPDD